MSSFPLLPGRAVANSCTSEHHQINYEKCDGTEDDNKALVWDNERCRCVESENSNEMNNAYNACVSDSDGAETSGTHQANCMMDNVLEFAGLSNCISFLEDENESASSKTDQCLDSISVGNSSGVEQWQNRLAMVNGLLSIIMWISHRSKAKESGMCASSTWMTAASVAGIANELINYFWFESKLRDLQVDFYEKVLCDTSLTKAEDSYASSLSSENETDVSEGCANQDPFETQTKAFDYLYDERMISSNVHFKKMISYSILSVIYTVAWIAAIMQIGGTYGTSSKNKCYMTSSSPAEPAAGNIDFKKIGKEVLEIFAGIFSLKKAIGQTATTYQNNLTNGNLSGIDQFFKTKHYSCKRADLESDLDYRNCMSCMKNDENQEIDCSDYESNNYPLVWQLIAGGGAVLVGAGIVKFSESLNKLSSVLIGQIILSITGMILSVISAVQNGYHYKEALAQAEDIDEIRDEFLGAISLYCPDGREDPDVLECYCYEENGERRTDRENSESCQNLFAQIDNRYEIESQDLTLGQASAKLSCVTIDGNPDPDCNCQKFTDGKTGRNACFQVPLATGSLGNLMSGTGANDILDQANVLSGSDQSGNLNTNSSFLGATNKLSQAGKKLFKNINNKLKQNNQKPLDITGQKIGAIMSSIPAKRLLTAKRGSSVTTNPISEQRDVILKKAKEKIKKTKASFTGGQGLSFNKSKDKKGGMNFDFDSNSGGNKMKNFMDKKYKYKKDDIVKNDNASIWKVITNRYNNSGYPRLFEE